ncbi:RNA polymerase sigma factor [Limnoglobus roseus]|uniref:RNA polymerase sigma factor n=1 Tax=Limnoglobus roseus TaxID=2598579 RepID=UPI00143DBD12
MARSDRDGSPKPLRLARVVGGDPTPDADLLARFAAAGDGAAFAALVERHGPMVLGVCRRVIGEHHAAEDAFQAAFLTLARNAGRVRDPRAVAGWLYGTVVRVSLKARGTAARTAARKVARKAATERAAPLRPGGDPLAEITGRELVAAVDEELARLPERFRAAVVLCCLDGLSQADAAHRLGCSPGALKGRLERGRARFGPASPAAASHCRPSSQSSRRRTRRPSSRRPSSEEPSTCSERGRCRRPSPRSRRPPRPPWGRSPPSASSFSRPAWPWPSAAATRRRPTRRPRPRQRPPLVRTAPATRSRPVPSPDSARFASGTGGRSACGSPRTARRSARSATARPSAPGTRPPGLSSTPSSCRSTTASTTRGRTTPAARAGTRGTWRTPCRATAGYWPRGRAASTASGSMTWPTANSSRTYR